MRKIAIALLTLGLAAIIASPAAATVLLADPFTYPDGNLAGNGGWASFSGAGTDIQVISARAVGYGPNAIDDHKLFSPPQPTTDKTYACFNVTIPTPPVLGAPKPIFFAMLKDATVSIFVSRVYVLAHPSGTFTFGISNTSTNTLTAGATPWPTALSYDTEYIVAICYDPATSTSTLWVDPVDELSPNVMNTNGAFPPVAVTGFGLRQSATAASLPPPGFPGTADWAFSVDNLGVATTFADACANGPTPTRGTTWGQVKSIYR